MINYSSPTICTLYLKNYCHRGESCTFSHSEPPSSRNSSSPMPPHRKVCKFFLQDKCIFGEKCTHSHQKPLPSVEFSKSSSSDRSIDIKSPQQDSHKDQSQSDWAPNGDETGPWVDHSEQEEDRPAPGEESKSPCIFFLSGRCAKSDDCEFSHLGDKSQAAVQTQIQVRPSLWNADETGPLVSKLDVVKHQEEVRSHFPLPDVYTSSDEHPTSDDDADDADEDDDHSESKDDMGQDQWNTEYQEENTVTQIVVPADLQQNETATEQFQTRRGPGSWYGSGWDEQDHAASPSPTHPKQTHEPKQSDSPQYPHISQVVPHWSQFADPYADPKIHFCKAHARGECTQGDSCRFRHALTPDEYTLLFGDEQPNLWTIRSERATAQSLPRAPQPSSILSSLPSNTSLPAAEPLAPSASFKKECAFFPLGKCQNGDRCPYRHDPSSQPANDAHGSQDQEWGSSRSPNFSRKPSKYDEICRFITSKGYCKRGDECRYSHGESSGPSKSNPVSKVTEEEHSGWGAGWENNDNNEAKNDVAEDMSNDWGPVPEDNKNEDNGWSNSWDETNKDNNEWNWGGPVDNSGWELPPKKNTERSGTRPSTTDRRQRSKPCHSFARGACTRGESCKFAHDVESSQSVQKTNWKSDATDEWPPTDNSSQSAPWVVAPQPCQYYAKGKCRKGDQCKFRHDSDAAQNSSVRQSQSNHEDVVGGAEDSEVANLVEPNEMVETESAPQWTEEVDEAPPTQEHLQSSESDSSGPVVDAVAQENSIETTEYEQNIVDWDVSESHTAAAVEDVAPISIPDTEELSTNVHDHESPLPQLELEPPKFDHPETKCFIMSSEVLVGEDARPQKIATRAESKKLVLSNLPVDVSPRDIEKLAERYGSVLHVIGTDQTASALTAEVEFAETDQAYKAFKNLHGEELESMVISASLKAYHSPIVRSPNQLVTLKVVWPKPSMDAWIHYSSISVAKDEANRLSEVILRGRGIKATFVSPKKNTKTLFAVHLQNLAPNIVKSDLEGLCPKHVVITPNPPTYIEDATLKIRSMCEKLEGLEEFDDLPSNNTGSTQAALVTFRDERTAKNAFSSFQQPQYTFLQQPLKVLPVHYSCYQIPQTQFSVIKMEIDRLTDECISSKKCTIQCTEHLPDTIASVRIFALHENLPVFAQFDNELRLLLRGLVVMSDGREVWDGYFEMSSSEKALQTIQENTNTKIYRDDRYHNIRIFGTKEGQEKAQLQLKKLLAKVHAQRHEIGLFRPQLRLLAIGGFKMLQDEIGINKIALDVVSSRLIVRGSSDEVSKVEGLLSTLPSSELDLATNNRLMCQLCHRKPTDPFLLTCRHAYCATCMHFYIRNTGSAPLQCLAEDTLSDGLQTQCNAHVPYVVLRDNLSTDALKNVLRLAFLSYVRSKPDEFFFCPTPECQSTHRVRDQGVNIKCSLCASEICTFCKSLAHAGLPCPGENRD